MGCLLALKSRAGMLLTAWLKCKGRNPGALKPFGKGNAEEALGAFRDSIREPWMIGFAILLTM